MKLFQFIFIANFLVLSLFCKGQAYYRIEADYSIKEKSFDGQQALQMGKVYFDKSVEHIIYKLKFPTEETIVMCDTLIVSKKKNGEKSAIESYGAVTFSVFNILLQGELPYFGLKNLPYTMIDVTKEDTLVVSTWISKLAMDGGLYKIKIAQHDKKLYSLVGFNQKEEMMLQQFYENYSNVDGLDVPSKILSFYFVDGKKSIEWLTLKDITLNSQNNDEIYSLTISTLLEQD